MTQEREKQEQGKWPFDPMQPGDHEPVRMPEDHPARHNRPQPGPEKDKEQ